MLYGMSNPPALKYINFKFISKPMIARLINQYVGISLDNKN